jgi:hypothetical protein
MFKSYIELSQDHCGKELTQIGQKLYLTGAIIAQNDLGIQNWREYKIKENNQDYIVQIPLWHMVLTSNDPIQIKELVSRYTVCECGYYDQVGYCRHITAVFCSLESEFIGFQKAKTAVQNSHKADIISTDNFIDNLFDFQKNKWEQQSLQKIELFFNKNSNSTSWIESIILEIKKTKNIKFQKTVVKIMESKCREYESEKKVIIIMEKALVMDFEGWFEIIIALSSNLTTRNYYKFWGGVWRLSSQGIWGGEPGHKVVKNKNSNSNSKQTLNIFLGQQSLEFKSKILEWLKENYENSPQLWLQFLIDSKYEEILLQSLNAYDPELMLDIIEILPEQRELIEQKILQKVKVWLDFLITGDYGELQLFLNKWRILGRSYYFEKIIEYIKLNHPKKRSLITFVNEL